MSLVAARPTSSGSPLNVTATTFFISNLHCPSCVEGIKACLSLLTPKPEDILVSIVSQSVVVHHITTLSIKTISQSLDEAGFEVHSVFQDNKSIHNTEGGEHAASRRLSSRARSASEAAAAAWRRKKHLENCDQCKQEAKRLITTTKNTEKLLIEPEYLAPVRSESKVDFSIQSELKLPVYSDFIKVDSSSPQTAFKATLSLSGLTCSSCVSAITHAVEQLSYVQSIDVNLLTNSGVVIFSGRHNCEEIVETIEDCGFDATLDKVEEVHTLISRSQSKPNTETDKWRATYNIEGLTCAACVGNVTRALEPHSWIDNVEINLVSNIATVTFTGKEHLPEIEETIEDVGYGAKLDKVIPDAASRIEITHRTVGIRIDGMFCHHCPGNITRKVMEEFGTRCALEIEDSPLSLQSPILHIKYTPNAPQTTIRDIFRVVKNLNSVFSPSIYHPPTIEERAREMHALERRRLLFRLILCVVMAIPTFILGIVFMSLVSSKNPIRTYLMQPLWSGNTSRLTWALFILATPVYFLAADTFHRRALKEIKALWRRNSRTPIIHRFVRFGSMNMLMSLGTTIAYFASVVEVALAASGKSSGSAQDTYFDSVVFLTMFLLAGRFLESYSKAKTGDAVTSLRGLRPNEAVLVDSEGDSKISIDLLEIGDVVRIHHGTSPPFDGTTLDGSSIFDEASLTGESKPVTKASGDAVYSGTVNKGAPVKMKITATSGSSMLDQIINTVREGQTRRAPIERVADSITSHFVPFVIVVAITTWLVWLILGTTKAIPEQWKDDGAGGWPLWSLRFAIAVFVIACPCGIGLAAPTALFVGGGLAAKHGILVKGGGDAFQEASALDCIVFDKTGTLTQGGAPAVTNHQVFDNQNSGLVFGLVKAMEENSNHPIARALVSFCSGQAHDTPTLVNIDEVLGKGLKGTFRTQGQEITVIIGNEELMSDHQVEFRKEDASLLQNWKLRGESIALMALLNSAARSTKESIEADSPPSNNPTWELACAFAVADPIRPEAVGVIRQLQNRGVDVWMLSGDNPVTAGAVGLQLGIPSTNIIAGVLPNQKAEKIKYLQQTLTKPVKSRFSSIPFLPSIRAKQSKRAIVAMVGDGINDAPALSAADLSIAIGSGSDVAISSSSFILLNSQLTTILTLLDLSRVVFRRVYFNFGWALVYNLTAMPIAAGVLYPVTSGANHTHIRLDPVWASLAMAMSSLSVVCSSLALRSRIPGLGFKASACVMEEAGEATAEKKSGGEIV